MPAIQTHASATIPRPGMPAPPMKGRPPAGPESRLKSMRTISQVSHRGREAVAEIV
jgi:hypothetical protein